MAAVVFCRVKGRFGWGQSEDQPSVAGVDRCESEHVAKEGAVGFCILAVDDDVCAGNHDCQCSAVSSVERASLNIQPVHKEHNPRRGFRSA